VLADPIRLAFRPPGRLDMPEPMDGGPALGPDEAIPIPGDITFDEVLQGLNPLHHLPGVGIAYRAVTGEDIHPVMRACWAQESWAGRWAWRWRASPRRSR
jgi:hypothetical protein